jgi:hypothetical protein
MRLLDGVSEIEKTTVFGTSVHAVLRGSAGDATALVRRHLEAAAIGVVSTAIVQPSLEDVFLEVVEQRGRASAA